MPTPTSAGSAPALEVRVVNPLEEPDWDRWVAAHPEAGPFHGSAWARVLARSYGHRSHSLLLHRAGRPAALVPLMEVTSVVTGRRGVCLPFSDHCGPLLFEWLDPRLLIDVLLRLASEHEWKHVEVRGSAGMPPEAAVSASFFGHHLDLTGGADRVWEGFEPSVQRAVRKAEREQLTVEVRTDRQAVRAFVALHARSRRRHGLPPQPDRFFDAIQQEILAPGLGAVVLASQRSTPVAAAVFFHSGAQAVYKFGASDERAQATRANNLVMWHGLQWLINRGASSLSFGRTSCSQEGLRRYKRGWGAIESPLSYHTLTLPDAAWALPSTRPSGLSSFIFSRLPLPVNRLLGAMLYPHLD